MTDTRGPIEIATDDLVEQLQRFVEVDLLRGQPTGLALVGGLEEDWRRAAVATSLRRSIRRDDLVVSLLDRTVAVVLPSATAITTRRILHRSLPVPEYHLLGTNWSGVASVEGPGATGRALFERAAEALERARRLTCD